ncbi:MAG TPA: YhcH/YjgK/YiaL family protein [bacterium]|nr:YhcH/YjgK/YiaL family protein [bacterium]
MIIDKLENFKIYRGINKKFLSAFDFIMNCKKIQINDGKYEIEGNKVFALVQMYYTQPSDKLVWEAHRKYIDFQYVLKGTENIGYSHISDMQPISGYIDADDYMLFSGEGSYLKLKEDFFAIFFPDDCHKVRIIEDGISKVKKIVVKISVDTLSNFLPYGRKKSSRRSSNSRRNK